MFQLPKYTMARLPNPSLLRSKQKETWRRASIGKQSFYSPLMLLIENSLIDNQTQELRPSFVHLSHVLVLPIQKLYGDKLWETRQQIKLHGMRPPWGDHCLSRIRHTSTGKSQQGKRLRSLKHFRICSHGALMKTSAYQVSRLSQYRLIVLVGSPCFEKKSFRTGPILEQLERLFPCTT